MLKFIKVSVSILFLLFLLFATIFPAHLNAQDSKSLSFEDSAVIFAKCNEVEFILSGAPDIGKKASRKPTAQDLEHIEAALYYELGINLAVELASNLSQNHVQRIMAEQQRYIRNIKINNLSEYETNIKECGVNGGYKMLLSIFVNQEKDRAKVNRIWKRIVKKNGL